MLTFIRRLFCFHDWRPTPLKYPPKMGIARSAAEFCSKCGKERGLELPPWPKPSECSASQYLTLTGATFGRSEVPPRPMPSARAVGDRAVVLVKPRITRVRFSEQVWLWMCVGDARLALGGTPWAAYEGWAELRSGRS